MMLIIQGNTYHKTKELIYQFIPQGVSSSFKRRKAIKPSAISVQWQNGKGHSTDQVAKRDLAVWLYLAVAGGSWDRVGLNGLRGEVGR